MSRINEELIVPQSNQRLETLLSAHAVTLPTPEHHADYVEPGAVAALSEVYSARGIRQALRYIKLVKSHFTGRSELYDQFFKALKLYEEGRVELLDVLLRIMIICADAPFLLYDLNYFLPPGYSFNTSAQQQAVVLSTPQGPVLQQPFVPAFRPFQLQ
ncbi:hypothetical protein C8Q77DRAFT_654635 [Trametes polyzona]|nr:hypothetical protein C8Q77DRAFT_654635 [Trametes polyzona]